MKLIYEKWPYFLLSIVTGIVGLSILKIEGGLITVAEDHFSFFERLFIGSYSYIIYLIKSILPYKLVPRYFYPTKVNWIFYASMAPALSILGSTYYLFLKKKKVMVFGLLFFTFNIIFLLQILNAGRAFLADRFTYIAYFGIFFLYAFGLQWILEKYKHFDKLIYITVLLILGILGYLNFEQNKIWKNGESLWSHAIRNNPNEYSLWESRGKYYNGKGQYKKALHDYNQAIALAPLNKNFYPKRGMLYFRLGHPEELRLAIQDFTKAIHFSPEKVENLIIRGITHFKLNMYDNALQDYNAAERLDNTDPLIYFNRSIIFQNLGQHKKLQADLEKYVRLNPNDPKIWSNLGVSSRFNKQYEKSLNAFNRAIQMDPNKLDNYYKRSITYFEMGDIQQARNELNFLKSKNFKGINSNFEKMLNQRK